MALNLLVVIHTDGSCKGNGNIVNLGGWAATLSCEGRVKEVSGHEENTTNNRMELMACIMGLKALTRTGCRVHVYTDSQYVRGGITTWINGWKAKGWRTADKKPVKNQDLWMELDKLNAAHNVTWIWQEGHVGHAGNERADALASAAAYAQ